MYSDSIKKILDDVWDAGYKAGHHQATIDCRNEQKEMIEKWMKVVDKIAGGKHDLSSL